MKALKKLKLNSKGFSHVELLLVIVVVVAIAGVGVFVYKHDHKTTTTSKVASLAQKPLASSTPVKGSSLKDILPSASAYNMSHIDSSNNGWDIYACKQYVSSSYYGPYYHIIGYFYKPAADYGYALIQDGYYNSKGQWNVRQQSGSSSFYASVVSGLTINLSVFNPNDQLEFYLNGPASGNLANGFAYSNLNYIVNC
jgi:uncharacterized protein (UPF0333 family)